jgi:hypothetical protein
VRESIAHGPTRFANSVAGLETMIYAKVSGAKAVLEEVRSVNPKSACRGRGKVLVTTKVAWLGLLLTSIVV